MSATRKGRALSPKHCAAISAGKMGVKLSPEHCAAIGRASRGRVLSAEARTHMSAVKLGKPKSPAHRAALSASLMGHPDFVLTAPVKGECVYCFAPATTEDHMIPRGRPGWDDPDNVVPACLPCNASKGRRTPEEWFASAR